VTPPKDKNGRIPPKVKVAIDAMLDGADLAKAALASGLNVPRLRKYLSIGHIHRYAWNARRERLEALCLSTPRNLRSVIETSPNAMARVAAVRQAEQIRREDLVEAGEIPTPRGLQIVIVERNGIERPLGSPAPMIEHKPIEAELAELAPGR
jgi:hypothetical protein